MLYTYSIMHLAEDHFEERARDIVEQVRSGVALMPLFSMTLNPEGDPVWDKIGPMMKNYIRYRDRLAKDGVECGVLIQASLGHSYARTPPPFQGYVNLTDGKIFPVCCPLDEDFLNHFCEVLRSIAKEHPKAIMLDDDFRLMMRQGKSCACPRHLAEFNRRAGTNMRREELWAHIQAHDKNDPLKRIFEQTQKDSLLHAATVFRAAIDEVDPTIQGINCTSGHICESVVENNKVFAGKGNPTMVRVPNGCYAPLTTRSFSKGMSMAAICASKLKKHGIDILLAETDTIPFNRYAKSARYLHAHFTASILEGLRGAKHWLTRGAAFEPESGKAYRKILSEHCGLYNRLVELAPTISWIGLASAFIEQNEVNYHAAKIYRNHNHLWTENVFERMGLPFYFAENCGKVTILEENIVNDMTDKQIRDLFDGSVFLDGESAQLLYERGYGNYLGVKVEAWDLGTVTGETFDGTVLKRTQAQKKHRKLTVSDERCEILTHNYLRQENGAKLLAPAVTVLEREGGKLTVVFCGSPDAEFTYTEGFAFLNETRKAQFIDLLRRANALPVYFVGDDEICLRAGSLPDGRLLTAIYELGIDPVEVPRLYLEKKPSEISMLTPDGTEQPLGFTPIGDNIYELSLRIEPMYPIILLIK